MQGKRVTMSGKSKKYDESTETGADGVDSNRPIWNENAPKKNPCAWGYPALVFLVIFVIYALFMFWTVLPSFARLNSTSSDPHSMEISSGGLIALVVIFHILFILVLTSYFRAMCSPPGYIPNNAVRNHIHQR